MGLPPGVDPGPAPPAHPPIDKEKWKFYEKLHLQNPMLVMNQPTGNKEDKKQEDEDEKKKLKRIAEIKARKKFKSKGTKTSISSGLGTVSPILYSYPGSYTDEGTGGGFSFSQIPSIVWIILAVAGGIFMIKSARKR